MPSEDWEDITLSVTQIIGHIPECVGPFEGVPYAPIGSLFHDICSAFLSDLENDPLLWKRIRPGLVRMESPQDKDCVEKAIQPMRDFIYDELLRRKQFDRFQDLTPRAMLALWSAIESFLAELAEILHAADKKGLGPRAVLLGNERSLNWVVDLDGCTAMVKGRYDLLLYDHRFDAAHLIDFKLCGVRKDMANLIQIMLYAVMLNKSHGICPGATILNLYPRRSPITIGWEQIKSFQGPLIEFIKHVASTEFPGRVKKPEKVPDPCAELGTPGTPFETPALLEEGMRALELIRKTLGEFGLKVEPCADMEGAVIVGPSYTILRIVPGPGVKVASLANRSAELQVALATQMPPRIEPAPGYVRVEVPRNDTAVVKLLDLNPKKKSPSPACFILGVDIRGDIRWGDFSKPAACHMLVAGQTGSGKSEFLRQLLCSLAISSEPNELQMLIVDPKMTDYQDFNGSPYLKRAVVDRMEDAVGALHELTDEMDRRYGLFAKAGVKDLAAYNRLPKTARLARVVVAFDEFADAMADKDLKQGLESSLKRLGAKARAAGIHVIIATQTPRKEIVTGLIKANLPCAVALQVANSIESRIIIDGSGAERLLGRGDLIAKLGGRSVRLQSPFADAETVRSVMFPG